MTTPLISLLPGGITTGPVTWPNDGGASGGSGYDLDTINGTSASITRTTDSKTSQNMLTLSTAADADIEPTSGTVISDPWSFVMFCIFDLGDLVAAGGAPTFFDTKSLGGADREFVFWTSGADKMIALGRQSGPPHTEQTSGGGRMVLGGRFHTGTGTPQDLYVSNGVDQRNWIPTTPVGVAFDWCTLFRNRTSTQPTPMSFGEIHVWDSLLSDAEYMSEIRLLESSWEAEVSNKTGGNF